MPDTNLNVILDEQSPDGRWALTIYACPDITSCLLADIRNLDGSAGLGSLIGAGFGPEQREGETVSVRWDLPDGVCGIYVGVDCYGLFRAGAGRRRNRDQFRVGKPFTADEIADFCAKKRVQFRR